MIGRIFAAKSFSQSISYCLDKKEAELLNTNYCFGEKKDLIIQFNEVRRLNQNLSKPVQHTILSWPKGEQLNKALLVFITEDWAKDFGFDKNQYILVAHHDTAHPHVHIVANRVGFEGKTVKDSHNYWRMAVFCSKMEEKHSLQKVLSPIRFLPKEERHLPRTDKRKENLRNDIKICLATAKNYSEFELQIKKKGYQVYKNIGITFADPKRVFIKGSKVGFSLAKIEEILSMQPEQKILALQQGQLNEIKGQSISHQYPIIHSQHFQKNVPLKEETEILLRPTPQPQNINPALLRKKRQKRKRLGL